MANDLYAEAQALQNKLTEWRHDLHQIPELGVQLPKTSAYVQACLRELGVPYQTIINGNGIVAQLGQGDACLLLRADMDALPVREESGEAFAAHNGNMHACGHDMHAASLLGAAALIKQHEAQLKGTIKLLFQPGEETFSGAQAALQEGVLESPCVDAAVAVHVAAIAPVGLVAYGDVPYASVYGFKITLTGKGTHGAMPAHGIDPINAAVQIYLALQALIAREVPAAQEVTLTIGQLSAGTVSNVIPETAVLQGTLRVFDNTLRKQLIRRIGEISKSVADTYRCQTTLEVLCDVPPLICDTAYNKHLAANVKKMDSSLIVRENVHTTASEDFAFFSERVKTAMFMVGAQVDDGTVPYNQHNPKVRFNDKALPIAAAVYAAAALNWQRAN